MMMMMCLCVRRVVSEKAARFMCMLNHCLEFYSGVVAWRSGNGVGRINEVTLRRARLVLGWVTCPGSTPGGGTLFRYI